MDNKKWSKRFSTIFWWLLTIAPILVIAIYYITILFSFNRMGGSFTDYDIETIFNAFSQYDIYQMSFGGFDLITIPFLTTTFESLFNNVFSLTQYELISVIFGYMASIQLYHLIYDFVVWLPRACHELMERKL